MVAVVVVVAVAAIGAWLVLSGGDDPADGDAGGPEPGPTEGTVVASVGRGGPTRDSRARTVPGA